jgi:cell fate regulator YaaT (PSP1 superfamily)
MKIPSPDDEGRYFHNSICKVYRFSNYNYYDIILCMNPIVVGIRFQDIGKIYHFDSSDFNDIRVGDFVVVDTSRGCQVGEVMQIVADPPPPPEGVWKSIKRIATARDLLLRQLWQKKEMEAVESCRAKIAELNILGVKIVSAEYTFDGKRLFIQYCTEAEGKVDLNKLQQEMKRLYPRTRVGMRQVGPRDVAKTIGGMGACGMGERCCSKFLTEFNPISIRMAKEQGISLTPSEITGICGRLRCCLLYENDQYCEARKKLPKRKARITTPQGEGQVVDINPMKHAVSVQLETGNIIELSLEDMEESNEKEAIQEETRQVNSISSDGEKDLKTIETSQTTNRASARRKRPSRRNRWKK